jgi:predicted nucleotidyltransferase
MVKRAPSRSDQVRSAIAQEAARLMVEHGIQDYLAAKKKAAERYGVAEGSLLPKNSEIEAALASHQRLFGGAQHARSLHQQRRVAMEAMRLLQQFEPRLVGAVLNGSATEHSDIQLHAFSDTPELLFLHLADRRYEYEVLERKLRRSPEQLISVPSVRFEMGMETIEVYVFPAVGIRQAPISPVDGKPMRRAGLAEISTLVESSQRENQLRGSANGH